MNLSHLYRRTAMLIIGGTLGVLLLAGVLGMLSFSHATAHAYSRVQHVTTARMSFEAIPTHAMSRHIAPNAVADNCEAVPSWDITQQHLLAKHQYALVGLYINWERIAMS